MTRKSNNIKLGLSGKLIIPIVSLFLLLGGLLSFYISASRRDMIIDRQKVRFNYQALAARNRIISEMNNLSDTMMSLTRELKSAAQIQGPRAAQRATILKRYQRQYQLRINLIDPENNPSPFSKQMVRMAQNGSVSTSFLRDQQGALFIASAAPLIGSNKEQRIRNIVLILRPLDPPRFFDTGQMERLQFSLIEQNDFLYRDFADMSEQDQRQSISDKDGKLRLNQVLWMQHKQSFVFHRVFELETALNEQLFLVFSNSNKSLLTDIRYALRDIVGIIATITVLVLALIVGVVRIILRNVELLTDAAVRVSNGELGFCVQVESHDQIGQLSAVFNNMSTRLKKDQQDLELATQKERALNRQIQESLKKVLAFQHNAQEELALAAKLHSSIFPKTIPQVPGFSIFAETRQVEQIGGDIFLFFTLDEHRTAIFLADICGHGIPAAILCTTMAMEMARVVGPDRAPDQILTLLNTYLMETLVKEPCDSAYMTGLYGVLDCEQHSFTFARGGHPFPIKVTSNGVAIEEIKSRGLAMGILQDTAYQVVSTTVLPGERLVLFSDGLFELLPDKGIGEKQSKLLCEFFQGLGRLSCADAGHQTFCQVHDLLERELLGDDVTMIMIEAL